MAASGEVVYDWLVQGRGIGQKALWDVEQDLRSGKLVECLNDYACHDIALDATWRTQAHLPLRRRTCIDYLAQTFNAA